MTATALSVLNPEQEYLEWEEQEAARHKPKLVPEEIREAYARETSLRQFYMDCIEGRWEPLGRPERKSETFQKDRQSLNRWEKYSQPANWRGGIWEGPKLSFIESVSESYLDNLWKRMVEDLAAATVGATRSHLLTIMRHAVTVGAITRHPAGKRPGRSVAKTRIYTPVEVQLALEAFENEPLLHAAFWLDLHVGPRTEDLFLLQWTNFVHDVQGRRMLVYEAIKTGKLQGIPIADCVWEVLDRLDKTDPHLFPELSNPRVVKPEKSVEAKVRNTLAKRLMRRAGIIVPNKPWQVARATCNERYEAHHPGVGEFILGHRADGVNATSYRDPTDVVWRAVLTLPSYTKGTQQKLFG